MSEYTLLTVSASFARHFHFGFYFALFHNGMANTMIAVDLLLFNALRAPPFIRPR